MFACRIIVASVFSFSFFIHADVSAAARPLAPSDHFDGSKFFNPGQPDILKSLWQVAWWKLTGDAAKWPEWVENSKTPELATELSDDEVSTTFINHATHLLQLKSLNILTDPVFSKRVSPVSWAGPKRVRAPGLSLEALPQVDVVVISHNHFDHMDAFSIGELAKRFDPVFIVPLANGELMKDFGAKKIIELDWWQTTEIGRTGTNITLVPAMHWSARGVFDRNRALWGGYVVRNQHMSLYFAGDTGYGGFFSDIQKNLGPMDLSIIPIGAYEPRWFMKEQHMNPQDAVQAHLDLNSKLSIGTHYGTFQLTDEAIDAPILTLQQVLKEKEIEPAKFRALDNGETLRLRVVR